MFALRLAHREHKNMCSRNISGSWTSMCLPSEPSSNSSHYCSQAAWAHAHTGTPSSRLLHWQCRLLPCLSTTQLFCQGPQGKEKQLSVLLTICLSRPKRPSKVWHEDTPEHYCADHRKSRNILHIFTKHFGSSACPCPWITLVLRIYRKTARIFNILFLDMP